MSWAVSIPPYVEPAEGQEFVNEVEAEKIAAAIDDAHPVEGDLSAGPAKQLRAAKEAAHGLVENALKGKRAYRVNLAGHSDAEAKAGNHEVVAVEVVAVP